MLLVGLAVGAAGGALASRPRSVPGAAPAPAVATAEPVAAQREEPAREAPPPSPAARAPTPAPATSPAPAAAPPPGRALAARPVGRVVGPRDRLGLLKARGLPIAPPPLPGNPPAESFDAGALEAEAPRLDLSAENVSFVSGSVRNFEEEVASYAPIAKDDPATWRHLVHDAAVRTLDDLRKGIGDGRVGYLLGTGVLRPVQQYVYAAPPAIYPPAAPTPGR
jgi:hypothetical protein